MMGSDDNAGRSKQGRVLALVIAVTALGYVGVQMIGASLGWSNRTLAFFDLAALAVFGWTLVNAFLIWRSRQNDKDG